jgi:phosphatidate cytidylyltransferase
LSNLIVRFISSIIILAFTFFAFNIGGHLVLIFCSLIIFLLFLEVNLVTLQFSKKFDIFIFPIFGAITPFFIKEGILFLVVSLIILFIDIIYENRKYLRMFVHSYVLISLYFFLEFIYEISDTLNLDKPLFLLSIVIASDIGGYIVGKLIGNIKIAPNISPNKTIEGTFGSIFFTLIVWIIFFRGFASNFIIEIIYVVIISLFAQLGDLLVSFGKRRLAIKESSYFIPGHGGVFDRMDSIIGGILGYSLILYIDFGLN